MSTECPPPEASLPAGVEVCPPFGKRHVGRIDELVRPLGAKRAALQLRRRGSSVPAVCRKVNPSDAGALTLASKDARVTFALRATALGLLIERTQRQVVGTRLVQVIVFVDLPAFERWCHSEPIRFEEPMLYVQLRREGYGAFGKKR
jgi:hypothetical protein